MEAAFGHVLAVEDDEVAEVVGQEDTGLARSRRDQCGARRPLVVHILDTQDLNTLLPQLWSAVGIDTHLGRGVFTVEIRPPFG